MRMSVSLLQAKGEHVRTLRTDMDNAMDVTFRDICRFSSFGRLASSCKRNIRPLPFDSTPAHPQIPYALENRGNDVARKSHETDVSAR